jgi:hypothetical protein
VLSTSRALRYSVSHQHGYRVRFTHRVAVWSTLEACFTRPVCMHSHDMNRSICNMRQPGPLVSRVYYVVCVAGPLLSGPFAVALATKRLKRRVTHGVTRASRDISSDDLTIPRLTKGILDELDHIEDISILNIHVATT